MHLLQTLLADLHHDTAMQLLLIILPALIILRVGLEAIDDITHGYFHWAQLGQSLHDDFKKLVPITVLALMATFSGIDPLLALDGEKVALVTMGLGVLTECAQEAERLTGWPIAFWQTLFENLANDLHLSDPSLTQPASEVSGATALPVQGVPASNKAPPASSSSTVSPPPDATVLG